jgi:hypothetical protein
MDFRQCQERPTVDGSAQLRHGAFGPDRGGRLVRGGTGGGPGWGGTLPALQSAKTEVVKDLSAIRPQLVVQFPPVEEVFESADGERGKQ